MPVIATEIMGIAQALEVCELHKKVMERTKNNTPIYVTHITGIFDDYMKKIVSENDIEIASDVLWQAGISIARKQYEIITQRGYNVTMLGGGARGLHHFTEMVGSSMHITINWKGTADKLIETNQPIVYRMDTKTPEYIVRELMEKIPDFKKAYMEDGLISDEYGAFGPVMLFRNSFLKGWEYLVDEIEKYKESI